MNSNANSEEQVSRLVQVRKSLGLSQKQLADALGINQSYLSEMERGKKRITSNASKLLFAHFKVSPSWLLEGIGDMLLAENVPPIVLEMSHQSKSAMEDEALRTRRKDILWHQIQNRSGIDLTGFTYAYHASVTGSYSDKVLTFIHEKADTAIEEVINQMLDGKIDYEQGVAKISEINAPFANLEKSFLAVEQAIYNMMDDVFKQWPDAKELVRGTPILGYLAPHGDPEFPKFEAK